MTRFGYFAVLILAFGCGDDSNGGAPADITVPGLTASVRAIFDGNGVLHAECQTDEDCAAALGYFHARDRFIQMDVRRRFARGLLTEIVSDAVRPLVVDFSVTNRAVFSTQTGRPLEEAVLEAASPKTRGLFDAYARGVNAWIEDLHAGENGARLPAEYGSFIFDLGEPPRLAEWTSEDSVASVLALIEALTNRSEEELALGTIAAQTDDATFLDLYGIKPGNRSTILSDFVGPPLPSAAALVTKSRVGRARHLRALRDAWSRLARQRFVTERFRQSTLGSNNWAVSASKSVSGNALLSNDPHLPMSNPALWYLAHIDAKTKGTGDIHAAGVTFAGIPFVVLGQSEHLAWGATTANMDLVDAYEETLTADRTGVVFNGEDVPFQTQDITLRFSDGSTQVETLRWVPHHGPVLSIDEESGTAVSIRWRGADATTDINALTEIYTATSVEEARVALTNSISIGQNWVVADTEGNIGWFPYNSVPVRAWGATYRPWIPVPGDGSAEWDGALAYEDLPQSFNPTQGFIATANNDMTGALADGDPTNEPYTMLQSFAAPGYRHARIVELLQASDAHSLDTMESIQADTFSLVGEQVVPSLLAVASGLALSVEATKVVAVLAGWNFTCPTGLDGTNPVMSPLTINSAELLEASGCTAFHVLLRELEAALIGDEVEVLGMFDDGRPDFRAPLRPAIEATIFSIVAPEELVGGDVYWDDVRTDGPPETKSMIVATALDTAGQFLMTELGDDETRWAWGRLHAMNMRSDLDTASSRLIVDFNHPLVANDGGLFTVDAADPIAGLDRDSNPSDDYVQEQGPSMRMNCEVTPSLPVCTIQLPGGQVGFTDSPHYDDLLDEFLRNESIPLVFNVNDAAEDAETVLVLGAP